MNEHAHDDLLYNIVTQWEVDRAFAFYHTPEPFCQDLERWHAAGIRIGEC